MKIFYDRERQQRVTAAGAQAMNTVQLRFKEQPVWEIQVLDGETPADLSEMTAWRAAVDRDSSFTTAPMCRSIGNMIDSAGATEGLIRVRLNTNTREFFSVIDGKPNGVTCYFELWGLDEQAVPAIYLSFRVTALGVVDPDGGDLPEEVDNGLCSIAEINAIAGGLYPLLRRLSVGSGGVLLLDGKPVGGSTADAPGADRIVLNIDGLSAANRASVLFEMSDRPDFPEDQTTVYDSASADDNAYFQLWGGAEFSAFPTAGINAVYNGGQILFQPPNSGRIHYRYRFRSEAEDTAGSYSSYRYGCLRAVGTTINLAEDVGF